MSIKFIHVYTVRADKTTGEWLEEPIKTNELTKLEDWRNRKDTKKVHYDTYEGDDETRAIIVSFVN